MATTQSHTVPITNAMAKITDPTTQAETARARAGNERNSSVIENRIG